MTDSIVARGMSDERVIDLDDVIDEYVREHVVDLPETGTVSQIHLSNTPGGQYVNIEFEDVEMEVQ